MAINGYNNAELAAKSAVEISEILTAVCNRAERSAKKISQHRLGVLEKLHTLLDEKDQEEMGGIDQALEANRFGELFARSRKLREPPKEQNFRPFSKVDWQRRKHTVNRSSLGVEKTTNG